MTEREYRAHPNLSYSLIKKFDEDRGKFYKKYVLQQHLQEEDISYAMKFGSLVDCLLFTRESVDEKFCTVQTGVIPTGQMKGLVDVLFQITLEHTNTEGVLEATFQSMMAEAISRYCYDRNGERIFFRRKTQEQITLEFDNTGLTYYESLRRNTGKIQIDQRMMEAAENTVSDLLRSPVTGPYLNLRPSEDLEIHKQLILFYVYQGVHLKSMIDFVYIDHKAKTIYFFDLKTSGWDIGNFDFNIIKERYYLQWSLYYKALEQWMQDKGLQDYIIEPMKFFVVSADRMEHPLIYTTSAKDLHNGLHGFEIRGKAYKGLDQLLTEIRWHIDNNIWKMSMEDYQNGGIKKVRIFE